MTKVSHDKTDIKIYSPSFPYGFLFLNIDRANLTTALMSNEKYFMFRDCDGNTVCVNLHQVDVIRYFTSNEEEHDAIKAL